MSKRLSKIALIVFLSFFLLSNWKVNAQPFGKFLSLDGIDDKLTVGNYPIPNNSDFTIEFWIKVRPDTNLYRWNTVWNNPGVMEYHYTKALKNHPMGITSYLCYRNPPTVQNQCWGGGRCNAENHWMSLVAQYDISTKNLWIYYDGQRRGGGYQTRGFSFNSILNFGLKAVQGHVNGRAYIDEFRISDTIRYAGHSLIKVPRKEFKPDKRTRCLWHFNDGNFKDASGNGYHLTATGDPQVLYHIDSSVKQYNLDYFRDPEICPGDTIKLNATVYNSTYEWENGSKDSIRIITKPGLYAVKITTQGCVIYDTVKVLEKKIDVDLGSDTTMCFLDSISVSVLDTALTYKWYDGSSDSVKVFNEPGAYWVEATKGRCIDVDTINVDTLTVQIVLPQDTVFCDLDSFDIAFKSQKVSYQWQDGTKDTFFIAVNPGLYWVEGRFGSCVFRDSILVDTLDLSFELGKDSALCKGDSIIRVFKDKDISYTWHNGSNRSGFVFKKPGNYWLTKSLKHCSFSDSITISTIDLEFNLGEDTSLCLLDTLRLRQDTKGARLLWHNGSRDSFYTTTRNGEIWLEKSIKHCAFRDSLTVDTVYDLSFNLGEDTILCKGDSMLISYSNSHNYLWQDGANDSFKLFKQAGLYWLEQSYAHCYYRDTLRVQSLDIAFSLGEDTTLCWYDSLQFNIPRNNRLFEWQDGSVDTFMAISTNGLYWLEISEKHCKYRDSITVDTLNLQFDLGSDASFCNKASLDFDFSNSRNDFAWQDGSTNKKYSVSQSGLYWLKQFKAHCSFTDSIRLSFTHVLADFSLDSLGDLEYCINNLSQGGDTFNWSFAQKSSQALTAVDSTTYSTAKFCRVFQDTDDCRYVCLEAIEGDCRDTICKLICPIYKERFKIPNVFTPSRDGFGDGLNDFFVVETNLRRDYELVITNRWGQRVFKNASNYDFWNGKVQNIGEDCPGGTYYYVYSDGVRKFTGVITLIWED